MNPMPMWFKVFTTTMLTVVGSVLLLAACSTTAPAPVSNACSWEQPIHLDNNFQARLTHDEKLQIATHNRNVHEFCVPTH
jgi:hypothetical protein